MENIIVALVILVIVALAGTYIYRAKKKGAGCVGCPHSGKCGSCNGHCSSFQNQD